MDLETFASGMPDLVKFTIVGIGIDPPLISAQSPPALVQTLEFLVQKGICVASASGCSRRYHLTALGAELRDIVETHAPRDESLPANDNHDDGPEAA